MTTLREPSQRREKQCQAEPTKLDRWLRSPSKNHDRAETIHQYSVGLTRMIETEIVPRLILAHRTSENSSEGTRHLVIAGADVFDIPAFASIVLANDMTAVMAFIADLKNGGTSLEAVYLQLLAPTARHLGDLWSSDLCSFTDVTIGLCSLHQAAREMARDRLLPTIPLSPDRRALLSATPGEQHTFGLLITADFFRNAGWDVTGGPGFSSESLSDTVQGEWFALVGLSLGSELRMSVLATCIRDIRRLSLNRSIGVIVGGPIFVAHPEFSDVVGADASAVDARQAIIEAERIVAAAAKPA